LKKPSRVQSLISKEEWEKHLEGLRAISVLASQANEFQYNKNRTEGKTGVIKPDLIPLDQKNKQKVDEKSTNANNPVQIVKLDSPRKSQKSPIDSSINIEASTSKKVQIQNAEEKKPQDKQLLDDPIGLQSNSEKVSKNFLIELLKNIFYK